ncbi:endonuclease/exonuclease/phosphatase family protein [Mycobacterium adipatum]|jgi:tyrosyl-DNA phosphodiesterase 2|uniref:endonuclease/exonuclease/phosphatase family protein n=1 Tax=Mycobacterium adipatum TaxID=1682113 RepID=UPI0009EDE623|nr:endonuclease/exonuclease/phosphatase family protein [Mycobacterium adipatum]
MDRLWQRIFGRPATVPVLRFDPGRQRWNTERGNRTRCDAERLALSTYNIWFNEEHADQRHRAIADLLAREALDIMVFQEVTPAARAVFLQQPWIREHYRSAAVVGGRRGNYGMLLLSRIPVDRVSYTRLPTRLSRGYLTAQLTVNGERLIVVGVHLESGKASAPLRARQLGLICGSVRNAENAVVLGDFNLRDGENGILPADYRDVWPMLRPGEPGYTEDTTINHMRFDMKDKHRHVRFDRVLTKGDSWFAESVDLLGREPISPALPRVFPSDHFGVRCVLRRS